MGSDEGPIGLVGGKYGKAPHVLVIPFNTQGHITPMLRLAKELARKGVKITFVSYQAEISRLKSTDSSSELQNLGITLVGLQHPGEPEDYLPRFYANRLHEAFNPVFEKLVDAKSAGAAGPTSILSDMFLSWTQDVADKLEIPRYMFVPSGIIFARTLQGCVELAESGQLRPGPDGDLAALDKPVCIPGLPPLVYHELPLSLRKDPVEFLRIGKTLWRSRGVLVNTFYELEETVVETWKKARPPGNFKTVPNIYAVGPLFSINISDPNTTVVHGLECCANKSLRWLGSQPPSSVLYVAFGTQAHLSATHIEELALGLEASNQRFLWVLPQSKSSPEEDAPSLEEVLPPGYLARVGDRGCIVTGWAPQLKILAHASTGAFLTHCGWNSSLESIMLGVPMIGWPHGSEQNLNCRYLVDDLKIASEFQTGPENILRREEVERVVRQVMVEPEGKKMRSRAEEIRRKATVSCAEGKSRATCFQLYLEDLHSLEVSRK